MADAVYVVTAPSIGSVGPNSRTVRGAACNWCGRTPTRFEHLHLMVHRAEGLPVVRLTNHLLISQTMAAIFSQHGIQLSLSPITQEMVEGVHGVLEPMALVDIRTTIPNRAMEHCPKCFATQSTTTAEISLFSIRQAGTNVAVLESEIPPDPIFYIGHDRIAVQHAVAALIHDKPEVDVREVPMVDPSQAAPASGSPASAGSGQIRREDLGLPPASQGSGGQPMAAIPLDQHRQATRQTGSMPPSALPAGDAEPTPPLPEDQEQYDPFAPAKVSSDDHDLPPDIAPVPRGGTWGTTQKRAAEMEANRKAAAADAGGSDATDATDAEGGDQSGSSPDADADSASNPHGGD